VGQELVQRGSSSPPVIRSRGDRYAARRSPLIGHPQRPRRSIACSLSLSSAMITGPAIIASARQNMCSRRHMPMPSAPARAFRHPRVVSGVAPRPNFAAHRTTRMTSGNALNMRARSGAVRASVHPSRVLPSIAIRSSRVRQCLAEFSPRLRVDRLYRSRAGHGRAGRIPRAKRGLRGSPCRPRW